MSNREEAIQLLRDLHAQMSDLKKMTQHMHESLNERMRRLETRLDYWLKEKASKQQFRQVEETTPESVRKLPDVDPEDVRRWAGGSR